MNDKTVKVLTDYISKYCLENGISAFEAGELLDKCRMEVLERLLAPQEGLFVLKRSGQIQQFDDRKLYNSIAGASDEIHEPLTSSDINLIVKDIIKRLSDSKSKLITSSSIREAVLVSLKSLGFSDVYRYYINYVKEY